MNPVFFIARRIVAGNRSSFARPVIRIAALSIALGVAVMIVAVAIVTGFQQEIRNKVSGFAAHIQISGFNGNNSLESTPVSVRQPFYPSLKDKPGIRHIQQFATKAGIVKTDDEILGVVLKGVGSDYDWSFFSDALVRGCLPEISDTGRTLQILISEHVASAMKFDTGSPVVMYFVNQGQVQPSVRKFKVAGIYNTGLEEFDKMYVLGDIAHIRRLNKWDSTQTGGFEVILEDFDDLDMQTENIYGEIGYELNCTSIRQEYPQIFDWLAFQDVNVSIIIIMMVIVAAINMISALLILIIEKTSLIGILKALGMKNWSIRKLFLYHAAYLMIRGLIWGNLIALILCLLQLRFGIVPLDPHTYYVDTVPVNLSLWHILLINGGTIMICILTLIVPTWVVTRISPVRAIRFS